MNAVWTENPFDTNAIQDSADASATNNLKIERENHKLEKRLCREVGRALCIRPAVTPVEIDQLLARVVQHAQGARLVADQLLAAQPVFLQFGLPRDGRAGPAPPAAVAQRPGHSFLQ